MRNKWHLFRKQGLEGGGGGGGNCGVWLEEYLYGLGDLESLGLVCMLNEEWKQTWTLERGIDVKICEIPAFWLTKNVSINFINGHVRSFAYHILYVWISSACKQNCHNFYKITTSCHVKRSQAILKEHGKCNTASLQNLICLSPFLTITITIITITITMTTATATVTVTITIITIINK